MLVSLITILIQQENRESTGLGEKADSRLRELIPRGQRETGGGIHATFFSPTLYSKVGRGPALLLQFKFLNFDYKFTIRV